MKGIIITVVGVVILAIYFYKPSHAVENMKSGIAQSFYSKSGFEVSEVKLFKLEDCRYKGIVTLKDKSEAIIEVTVDKDDATHYMWQCTQPSPSMMQGLMDKAFKEMDTEYSPFIESSAPPAPAPAP